MAIQANERLFPGNVVMYHGEEDMPCVLDAEDIYNISRNYVNNAEVHSPIPLTPEIMTEWCGFMPQSKNDVFVKTWGRNGIFIVQHDILQNEFYAQFSQFYRLHLKSLHHLQNVFYVHTGQELPVNIPGNH